MRILSSEEITRAVYETALRAGRSVTASCRSALRSAMEKEEGAARFALQTVLENGKVADRMRMPVCQDTGVAVVLIALGREVCLTGDLQQAVDEGIRRAYREGSFRMSVCDPLTRVNTGDNTPASVHVDLVEGDRMKLTLLPKGFGSENMSALKMLSPAEGREGVLDFIVRTVQTAGSRPCPPVYVGVGIGGTFDGCALLAKRALTREVGTSHPREDVRSLEEEALSRINALHIGAQGFGGKITALGVSCEIAPTHIAGLPVAVNLQCHCIRCEETIL